MAVWIELIVGAVAVFPWSYDVLEKDLVPQN